MIDEPKCEVCKTNYVRIKCDRCGRGICLICAKAVSDTRIECKDKDVCRV